MPTIDLSQSIYELTEAHPQLIDIMCSLGFSEIRQKPLRHSVGRVMTIPKGARAKKIPLESIVDALRQKGFSVTGSEETFDPEPTACTPPSKEPESMRRAMLKSYLRRLGNGEDLASVREDFVREMSEVDAAEIMEAEQSLLREGTPLSEIQRLCDLHSALFHGATREERIARAEEAVRASLSSKETARPERGRAQEGVSALTAIQGHPLRTLAQENEQILACTAKIRTVLREGGDLLQPLEALRDIAIHYAKKGDLIYPLLRVDYGISGPSQVMWSVDGEIRDELNALTKTPDRDDLWKSRLTSVICRIEEMVYKEKNILFPICADAFTEPQWHRIYADTTDYAPCMAVRREIWSDAEPTAVRTEISSEGEIIMPGGHLHLRELTAMLNTIPMELTFVDARDINKYFNEGPKVFKRPSMAIGRDVYTCHPPKIEPMVRAILDDLKSGRRKSVPVWMEKNGKPYLVTYWAVRSADGAYLGVLETVQDMEFARSYFVHHA